MGLEWTAKATGMSLYGVSIDFVGQNKCPKLSIGDGVDLEMKFPPHEIMLKGEVRSRIGRRYEILFPMVATEQVPTPPELKRIVGALVRELLYAGDRKDDRKPVKASPKT
jgi:hypothetical protein